MQKRPLRVAAPASSADTGDRLAAQLDQAVAQLHQAAVDLAALRAQIQSATDAGEPTSMLLSPEEVAIVLGIGRSSVYRLLESAELRRVSIGRLTRIPRADVDAYISRLLGASA